MLVWTAAPFATVGYLHESNMQDIYNSTSKGSPCSPKTCKQSVHLIYEILSWWDAILLKVAFFVFELGIFSHCSKACWLAVDWQARAPDRTQSHGSFSEGTLAFDQSAISHTWLGKNTIIAHLDVSEVGISRFMLLYESFESLQSPAICRCLTVWRTLDVQCATSFQFSSSIINVATWCHMLPLNKPKSTRLDVVNTCDNIAVSM